MIRINKEGGQRRIRANKLDENFFLYTQSIKGTNKQTKNQNIIFFCIVHFLLAAFGWVWVGGAGARGGVNGRPLLRPPY